ncbi:oligosaccharide flippase family protein [Halobacillus shinanisalinarum]|uniref:Oligosaccharide flippase family protein n=1 Tax=Halobacillus shinanisalinarum TaxID=2932258 RepID=A0ABY4H3Y0_9BACI|nr:oligosaccharide flippase family protein [Halobacillus shinanisalinarum]UOQ95064.1 oligosaccharide flippase family protein [Halobacillus shinanisalinarum]
MKKGISLKTNFKWMFASNIVFALFQWLLLIVLTKLGNQELVGMYTLGLAITAPIMIFSNLQLRAIQATDANNENEFKDFLSLRLFAMLFGLLVCTVIIFYSGYSIQLCLIIFLIAISKAIEGLNDIVYGFLQKIEDMNKIAISLILRAVLGFVLFSLSFYFTKSLQIAIIGLSLAWLLVLILWDIKKLFKHNINFTLHFNFKVLSRLFYVSVPLGFVSMLGSLNTNLPRYIIENQLSLEALGIFGAISYVLVGASKFTTSINQTVSPRLARYYSNGNKHQFLSLFKKTLSINLVFGLLGFVVVYFWGEEILTIVYSSEYADHYVLFRWIMIVSVLSFITSAFGVAVTSMRIFAMQLPIHLIKLLSITITSIFFIGKYGLKGAPLALAVSTLVSMIFYFQLFRKGIKNINNGMTDTAKTKV